MPGIKPSRRLFAVRTKFRRKPRAPCWVNGAWICVNATSLANTLLFIIRIKMTDGPPNGFERHQYIARPLTYNYIFQIGILCHPDR